MHEEGNPIISAAWIINNELNVSDQNTHRIIKIKSNKCSLSYLYTTRDKSRDITTYEFKGQKTVDLCAAFII